VPGPASVETDVLLRVALQDDVDQARAALETIMRADELFVPLPVLCEFVWVARSAYRKTRVQIAASIRLLVDDHALIVDRAAVNAGLAVLDAGGDFADGAIAARGKAMGGTIFASFDREAVRLLTQSGHETLLLDAAA